MQKILFWNCRGVGSKDFIPKSLTLIESQDPYIIVLVEIGTEIDRGVVVLNALKFDCFEVVEGEGFIRGIWLGWKSQRVNVITIEKNHQFIHIAIHYPKEEP